MVVKFKIKYRSSAEIDINSYLWSLDQFNINDSNKGQVTFDFFSNQSTNKLSKFLTLNKQTSKQYTTTPVIQRLCKILDDDLNRLLNDIEMSTSSESTSVSNLIKTNHSNILNEDLKYFSEYLQSNLKLFSQKLYNSLKELINSLETKLKNNDENSDAFNSLVVKKILLLCRFSYALPNNCPHFKLCFNNLYNQFLQQRQLNVDQSTPTKPFDSAQLVKKKLALIEQKVKIIHIINIVFKTNK